MSTPQHKTVKKCTSRLISVLKSDLMDISTELFSESLISKTMFDMSNNSSIPLPNRARDLASAVISKVEDNPANYDTLVNVLSKSGDLHNDALAEFQETFESYVHASGGRSTSLLQVNETGNPGSETVSLGFEPASNSVAQQIKTLQIQFKSLAFDARRDIEHERKINNPVRLEEFQHDIAVSLFGQSYTEHYQYLKENASFLVKVESLEELFLQFALYWNFMDCSFLSYVIVTYGSEDLKTKMSKYECDLSTFRKHTTLHQLIQCWSHCRSPTEPRDPLRFSEIKCKLANKDAKQCTLEELEHLRLELCREYSVSKFIVMLQEIEEGSLIITWTIPAVFVQGLTETIKSNQRSAQFFEEHSIIEISIDGNILRFLDPKTLPPRSFSSAKSLSGTPMDDLSISQELTHVKLDQPPGYWENVFQEELGVTTLKGLSLVGGDAYPILVRHVNHAWEKKKLRQLLGIESNEGELTTFKTQRDSQVTKLKARFMEVRSIQEELKMLQAKVQQRQDSDSEDTQAVQLHLEKNAREALQISPSTWESERESCNPEALISQIESLLKRIDTLLRCNEDIDGKSLLSNASNGSSLKGVLLSKILKEQTTNRAKLLKLPEEVRLTNPTHQQIIMTHQFTSEQDEQDFLDTVDELGYSAIVPSMKGGYWGVCIDPSLALSAPISAQDEHNITYFSTVKHATLPLASFSFSDGDLQLSDDALKDLKNIEQAMITNGLESQSVKLQKDFFEKYGSHAIKGPLHFGGSYTLKCSTRDFTHSQLFTVQQHQKASINMIQFGICPVAETLNTKVHTDPKVNLKMERWPSDISTMPEWKTGLVANSYLWSLIDRGRTLVPVWDILEMNHSKQFDHAQELVKALKSSWEKLTDFNIKPFASSYDQTDILEEVSRWNQSGNTPDASQITQQLLHLIHVKQDLNQVSVNPMSWAMLYLSQPSLQQFLNSIVNQHLDSLSTRESEYIKTLMTQLVERIDLNALKTMDFTPKEYIHLCQWLYNEQNFHEFEGVVPMDKSVFLSFGQYLNQVLEFQIRKATVTHSDSELTAIEQYQKSTILSSAVARAFELFGSTLHKCGQMYHSLFITTILYPFSYIVFYQPIIHCSSLQCLCDFFNTKIEEYFDHSILYTESPGPAETQAFLFRLAVDIYLGQDGLEIDVYAHQLIQHLLNLQSVLGKEIEPPLSVVLKELFLDHNPHNVNWVQLKLKLSSELRKLNGIANGLSLEEIFQKVADSKRDHTVMPQDSEAERDCLGRGSWSEDQLSCKTFVFEQLGLAEYYPQKMTLREAILIRKEGTETRKKYVSLLRYIMSYDYNYYRGNLLNEHGTNPNCQTNDSGDVSETASDSDSDSDSGSEDHNQDTIHPMDCLLALLHCADDFLRQDLMTRLVACQVSIPLILPDPFDESKLTMCLWAMRAIIKEWKSTNGTKVEVHECPLVSYPSPIVTFIRFGKQKKSKSQLMNSVISDSAHTGHFFHSYNNDSEEGDRNRLLGDGLVDVCWYLPAGKSKDLFTNLVAFLNLHGNANEYPRQIDFLSRVSFIVFALVTESDLTSETTISTLEKLSSAPGGLLLCTKSKSDKLIHLQHQIPGKPQILAPKKKKIREKINKKLKKLWTSVTVVKSPENFTDIAQDCAISVDESKSVIVQSKENAKTIREVCDEYMQSAKEKMLPLQGKSLWQTWAAFDKEEHRQLNRGTKGINEYSLHKQKEKNKIRQLQQQHLLSLSPLMSSFIETLLTTSEDLRRYYLHNLRLYLSGLSRQMIASLKHDYQAVRSELLDLQKSTEKNKLAEEECRKRMEDLQTEIVDASFGLEHLIRELCQVYEALKDSRIISQQLSYYLPEAGAELLIDGYPLELIDGDATHLPKRWVSAVLQEVATKLSNPHVFVLSMLGLQSTGKSTLINTAFGLQFNVSAGRCTRGAFIQLLPLCEELKRETSCEYILVVDTEGLRGYELDAQKTQKHDNELATFVIGIANETLINIYGETPGDMDDILQTAVHAFLRMKSVRLSPSCQFIHQNVAAVAARDKGRMNRSRFTDKLDKMTSEAAKEEGCEEVYQRFSDMIHFSEEDDVHHFPTLWLGDPPMAPINSGYSEAALELRSHLVKKLNKSTCLYLSEFQIRLGDLWKALLNEKFVFSFKNTLEVLAYNSLEARYVQWSWSFRVSMLKWEEQAKNEIKSSPQDRLAQLELQLLQKDLPKTVTKVRDELQKEMRSFFENNDQRDILVQWQVETENRLNRLSRELQLHANGFCQELTSGQKALEKVKKMHKQYKKQLKMKVKGLISKLPQDQLKKASLSENEVQHYQENGSEERKVRKMFDMEWEVWIEELKQEARVHKEEIDVDNLVQNSLTEFYKAEEQTVLAKLREKPFKQWGTTLQLMLREEHISLKHSGVSWVWKKAGNFFGKGREEQVISDPQHRECLQATTRYTFNQVRDYLSSRERENFNPTYTYELLTIIQDAIKERSCDHPHLTLTKEFTIDMSITACSYATRQFQDMVNTFEKENDPIEYLRQVKGTLYTIFNNQYFQTADEKAAACTFSDLLQGPIIETIKDSLATEVFQDMKVLPWVRTKASLKATVLISLGEAIADPNSSSFGEFDGYSRYLTNSNKSLQSWIKVFTDEHCIKKCDHHDDDPGLSKLAFLAFQKVDIIIAGIWNTVGEVTKAATADHEEGIDAKSWLEDIREKLTCTLVVTNFEEFHDLGISRKLKDIQNFKQEVKDGLDSLKGKLKNELRSLTVEELKKKPYDNLYDQLCGCMEQCPFCSEQCDATIPDHIKSKVKHSVEEHRPQCLKGYRKTISQEMVSDICSSDVGSDKTFECEDTDNKPRPYKEFDKVYPSWSITVNMGAESSTYWKWFVGNYSAKIAEYYGAKDNRIPPEWRHLTWEQAKQDVKDTFHV